MEIANRLQQLLKLDRRAVAIRFENTPPEGVPRIDQAEVSGCSYWRLAAQGQEFYTEAADHYGCPVGAHTHGIDLPSDVAQELEGLVGTMVELQYLTMDEVPQIPQLPGPFGVALYGPLDSIDWEPNIVLAVGTAKQMMLLAEAAHAAGCVTDASVVGRPTCAALPAVMASQQTAANLGCIGNRVYTELTDDELYFAIAYPRLNDVVEKLETIVQANQALDQFHRQRQTA